MNIASIKYKLNQLIYRLKKKNYTLYIYHEGTKQFEVHTTYKERTMRNAITEHFLSYGGNATLSNFKTYRDYNDYEMYYELNVDGDTYNFAMIKEVNGITTVSYTHLTLPTMAVV